MATLSRGFLPTIKEILSQLRLGKTCRVAAVRERVWRSEVVWEAVTAACTRLRAWRRGEAPRR